MNKLLHIVFVGLSVFFYTICNAQNPILNAQYTADPTTRVFGDKLYLYPSHDIPCGKNEGYIGFCMADYHVFSTSNLTDWKDGGVLFTQKEVAWADSKSFSMWAPDCVYKNSQYYFYFPVIEKDSAATRVRRIGVATSKNPTGPFVTEKNYIKGIRGIDPNVVTDKKGQSYLYWANKKNIYVAKLKDNMLELASEPQLIETPTDKFKEGPFVFERKGIYYLTYPMVQNKTELLAYGMGKNPLGPFAYKGIIMKESPLGCWTTHQSIVEFKKQWYLFYHDNDYSPKFDKNRSVKIDSLSFNNDGTINEVIPTLRGVGVATSTDKLHIDRYSAKSDESVKVDYIDIQSYLKGWKVSLSKSNSWASYNKVAFKKSKSKKVSINAIALDGGQFEIRLGGLNGKLIAEGNLEKSNNWTTSKFDTQGIKSGTFDLYFISKSSVQFEVDFVQFE